MIPFEYVRLAYLARVLLAAVRSRDLVVIEREARALGDALDAIADQFVAEDVVQAASEDPGPDVPTELPERRWRGPLGIPTRSPGRSAVSFLAGQMVGALVGLRRGRSPVDASCVCDWLLLLTGWSPEQIEQLLVRSEAAIVAEGGVT